MTKFVLATANPDKAREIVALLAQAAPDVDLEGRPADVPDVAEVGETLEDNARLKAVYYSRGTGLPSVADDSGLEIDALDGAPGIQSARWNGTDYPASFDTMREAVAQPTQ